MSVRCMARRTKRPNAPVNDVLGVAILKGPVESSDLWLLIARTCRVEFLTGRAVATVTQHRAP